MGQEELKAYRGHLLDAQHKSQADYDKTVLWLSGGALGVSFTFVKDIIVSPPVKEYSWLLGAWFCWGTSLLVVLFSYLVSVHTLRYAIKQVDHGTITNEIVGGKLAILVWILNYLGGALLVAGVFFFALFAVGNLD